MWSRVAEKNARESSEKNARGQCFLTHVDSHLEESPRGEGYSRQDFLFVFLFFLCWLILAYSNKLPFGVDWNNLHCSGRAWCPRFEMRWKILSHRLPSWKSYIVSVMFPSHHRNTSQQLLCLWSLLKSNTSLETIAKAGTLMTVTVSRHCFLSALLPAALCLMHLSTCSF